MDQIALGDGTLAISRVILGGHEYLPDGRSRAFNENLALAVTPTHLFEGFGGPQRQSVLRRAYALGITTCDVTIDSEKEALGRNLREAPPPGPVVIQTRPEGMVYGYDPGNRKLVEPGRLQQEVERILKLLGRQRLDILNIGILKDAIVQDRRFAEKLSSVVNSLKREGLVRCAAADTFSGAATYLAMLEHGAFDMINLNFNLADDGANDQLIPLAQAQGVRVVAREIFMKGELFRVAAAASLNDRDCVARAAIRWALAQPGIDALIIGAATPEQLSNSLSAAHDEPCPADEQAVLDQLLMQPALQQIRGNNRAAFARPIGIQ